jgi:citrate lyase subunit beta / citryl-CoA lyase
MRSLLFVPAHDERKLSRALSSGADALIVDLEDAVPDAEKVLARSVCAGFVDEHRESMRIFVRINAISSGLTLGDLAAIVGCRPYGVMLPKCSGGRDVALIGAYLSALEVREGIPVGALRVLPIVTECAAALFEMGSYAREAGPRLCGMMWGGEDLAADIGAVSNRDAAGRYSAPYELARSLCLLGATSAGVVAVDAVVTNFRDPDGLRIEAVESLRSGFTAKAAIHPDQVPVINEVFTPSEADVEFARRVVQTFEQSPGNGVVAIGGKMLDRPHLRMAERILARSAS